MRNLVVVVVIALAGFGLYRWKFAGADTGPVAEYGRFMTALRSTRFTDAREYLYGEQAQEDFAAYRQRDADLNRKFGGLTIRKMKFSEVDRERDGDSLYLAVEEELRTDPPGVSSAYGSANVWLTHEVEMVKAGGSWKVASFSFAVERAEGLDGVDVSAAHMWF